MFSKEIQKSNISLVNKEVLQKSINISPFSRQTLKNKKVNYQNSKRTKPSLNQQKNLQTQLSEIENLKSTNSPYKDTHKRSNSTTSLGNLQKIQLYNKIVNKINRLDSKAHHLYFKKFTPLSFQQNEQQKNIKIFPSRKITLSFLPLSRIHSASKLRKTESFSKQLDNRLSQAIRNIRSPNLIQYIPLKNKNQLRVKKQASIDSKEVLKGVRLIKCNSKISFSQQQQAQKFQSIQQKQTAINHRAKAIKSLATKVKTQIIKYEFFSQPKQYERLLTLRLQQIIKGDLQTKNGRTKLNLKDDKMITNKQNLKYSKCNLKIQKVNKKSNLSNLKDLSKHNLRPLIPIGRQNKLKL